MKRHQANDRPLRAALLGNAVFSALSGLACLLAADAVSTALFAQGVAPLGLAPADVVLELGILLLAFAGLVALIATRPTLSRGWAGAVIAADILWVLDSALLLAFFPDHLSAAGFRIVLDVAVLVALFAAGQTVSLALLYQDASEITVSRSGNRMTLTASLATSASAERVWQVMSDQEGYADVADNIGRVEILSGRGQGMIRRCSDTAGRSWRETCTLWEDGRAFAFRVHTEAEDYPYPIAELAGAWSLTPGTGSTRITMRFDIRAKPGLVNRALFALMAAPFARICDRLLRRWVSRMEGEARQVAARQDRECALS